MRSVILLTSVLALSTTFAFAAGCSSSDTAGANAQADTAGDLNLAHAAVAVIAGAQAHCTACHTASKTDVQRWGTAMQAVEHSCLDPALTLTNEQRLSCLLEDPSDPTSYGPEKLGLYAAGVWTDQFKQLFGVTDAGDVPAYDAFLAHAQMPADSTQPAMNASQFALVKKWVLAGMPQLDAVMQDPDLAGPCVQNLSPALNDHVTQLKSTGWAARLADADTPMWGCTGNATGADCLSSLPDITPSWNAPGQTQTLRQVETHTFRSHWWTRSSPDGRFTGFGLNTDAKMTDHTKPAGTTIDVSASYDPQFFPDNSGFSFAGTNGGNGPIKVCKESVLLNATTQITLNETGCSSIINSVYQTVGAALDGSVYLMSNGTHVNDDAETTGQGPRPGFDTSAVTTLTPMVSDGVKFNAQPVITLPLPFEGDQALSPSDTMLVTRFGSKSGKRGFKLRQLTVTPTGSAAAPFSATTTDIGTLCLNGAKPVVSYDERFLVTHSYTDPTETPDLPAKSSNVLLIDLKTGEITRLTTMKDRQYAFAPHFRADGWIYFIVRDMNSPTETVVASDAALRRMAANP